MMSQYKIIIAGILISTLCASARADTDALIGDISGLIVSQITQNIEDQEKQTTATAQADTDAKEREAYSVKIYDLSKSLCSRDSYSNPQPITHKCMIEHIQRYNTKYCTRNLLGRTSCSLSHTQVLEDGEARDKVAEQARVAERTEQERQSALREQREKETRRAEEEKKRLYANDLRAGRKPITSTNDAIAYYGVTVNIHNIMVSPFLVPDNKVYAGTVTVDRAEGRGSIIVKLNNVLSYLGNMPEQLPVVYAELKMGALKKNFGNPMRAGGQIHIVAQYIGNQDYRTVVGMVKTMPTFKLLYSDDTQDFSPMIVVR